MPSAPAIVINLPGYPFNNLDSQRNFAALRLAASSDLTDGQDVVVDGAVASGDGLGGVFNWNAASTATDDNATVIRPSDKTPLQAGRWVSTINVSEQAAVVFAQPDGSSFIGWLQSGIGAVLRTVQNKLRDEVSVKDFGAVGDNVANDTGAIAAAYASGAKRVRWPKGSYRTTAEINTNGARTIGDGRDAVTVMATAAIAGGVFKFTGQQNKIEGLTIAANNLANYGVRFQIANGSVVDLCNIDDALLDGVWVDPASNNIKSAIRNSLIRTSGTVYSTGTASNGANGTVITVVGAADLTTLGIRIGYDMVKIGTERAREIVSITSNTLTVFPAIVAANAGAAWSMRQGSAITIAINSNNGCIDVHSCETQNSAVAGIDCHALYGVSSIGNVHEFNEFGEMVGRRAAGGEQVVINYTSIGNYMEAVPSGHYYIGSAQELNIVNPVVDGITQDGLDFLYFADPVTMYSANITVNGYSLQRRTLKAFNTISGAATHTPKFGQTVLVFQDGVSGQQTIQLPTFTAGSNARALMNEFDTGVNIAVNGLTGTSFFIKTTAGVNVNGVDGATGLRVSAGYGLLRCTYHSDIGWSVSGVKLRGSVVYDPPSLGDGVGANATVTVTGAALGDIVTGVSFSLDTQEITVTAAVTAANTVTVRFQNETGGTVDLASGTLVCTVEKS